jgi:hypothetical protein
VKTRIFLEIGMKRISQYITRIRTTLGELSEIRWHLSGRPIKGYYISIG